MFMLDERKGKEECNGTDVERVRVGKAIVGKSVVEVGSYGTL